MPTTYRPSSRRLPTGNFSCSSSSPAMKRRTCAGVTAASSTSGFDRETSRARISRGSSRTISATDGTPTGGAVPQPWHPAAPSRRALFLLQQFRVVDPQDEERALAAALLQGYHERAVEVEEAQHAG